MGELLPFRRASNAATTLAEEGSVVARPRAGAERKHPLEPLWRESAGGVLRDQRHRLEQSLAEVADRAGISVQYLSEVERGRKEPSSEILQAVTGALNLTLVDLTRLVQHRLTLDVARRTSGQFDRPGGPVALAA